MVDGLLRGVSFLIGFEIFHKSTLDQHFDRIVDHINNTMIYYDESSNDEQNIAELGEANPQKFTNLKIKILKFKNFLLKARFCGETSSVRVLRAETRLTVYRVLYIPKQY